jgi:hypothetical protein
MVKREFSIFLLLVSLVLVIPISVFAHHPGEFGPISHLGAQQIFVAIGAA